jgi:hypothetical protein
MRRNNEAPWNRVFCSCEGMNAPAFQWQIAIARPISAAESRDFVMRADQHAAGAEYFCSFDGTAPYLFETINQCLQIIGNVSELTGVDD